MLFIIAIILHFVYTIIFFCRRLTLKTQENNTKSKNTGDEFINFPKSSELLFSAMDSNVSAQDIQCLEPEPKNEGMYKNVEKCEDDTLVIDNSGLLDVNRIQENMPEGRRIVDISFMWNEIHRTFDNHARGIECQFKDWKLINSRRCGLLTQLFFKCQMCNYEANI